MNFKKFNESVFSGISGIQWFDRLGIYKIDENKNAEIRLTNTHIVDNYDCYEVSIKHKDNGRITTHRFMFNDYLDPKGRIDNRHDYKGNFHVWEKAEWYIAIPSKNNISKLTSAIMHFIETYK